jgi:hypothetical protein
MVHQKMTLPFSRATSVILRTTALVIALTVMGCSTTTHVKQMSQTVIASMRKSGEKMVRTPEKTQEQYSCVPYGRRVFQLEEVQVLPDTVASGREVNQRIRYAFCPATPSETLRGRIIRTVLFKGVEMFRDVADHEFKPGTWTVDVFIGIPKEAQSGTYALDVVVKYSKQTIKETRSLVVKGT